MINNTDINSQQDSFDNQPIIFPAGFDSTVVEEDFLITGMTADERDYFTNNLSANNDIIEVPVVDKIEPSDYQSLIVNMTVGAIKPFSGNIPIATEPLELIKPISTLEVPIETVSQTFVVDSL